ncbi:hypothetical protein [Streptosporangium sp. NPDC002524]|uniref:hypothetical protein n=1 Tax=Streptosporangium sp. NPDC002524 TaxID=3154537 RepID=UPI003329D304
MPPVLPFTASAVLALGLVVPTAPLPASDRLIALRMAGLDITVPASVNLGGARMNGTISAHLGTVTVVDSRLLLASWVATVSATDFTRTGSPAAVIGKARVSYWSGPVTAAVGIAVRTPGQPTAAAAQSLSSSRTAFTKQLGVLGTSTSWNPTLIVSVPDFAVAGTYTGTVTHSVV